MTQVAVILSGCGHQDGAEIREAVLALCALSRSGAGVKVFAPDAAYPVVDHRTGKPTGETRNALAEAARIARGDIAPLASLNPADFDALVIPGGFGVAKNLSDLAEKGAQATVNPDFAKAVRGFAEERKPIGAICIAPAVVALVLGQSHKPTVTVGDDAGVAEVIASAGARHEPCATENIVVDEQNRIVTTPAYMRDDPLHTIAAGIDKLVHEVLNLARLKARSVAA